MLFILFLLKITPYIYVYFKPVVQDDPTLLARIQKIELTDDRNFYETRDRIEDAATRKLERLFAFDPNSLNKDGWQRLGLSARQAQSIVNYTQKGGKFYKPEDLLKMYTISPERYAKLLPFVQIKASAAGNFSDHSVYEKNLF